MQEQKLFQFFFFGTCVRYLQDVSPGCPIVDSPQGMAIVGNLRLLFKRIEESRLNVTAATAAAHELRRLLKQFEMQITPSDDHSQPGVEATADSRGELSNEQWELLNPNITSLRETLEAELHTRVAYVLTPKIMDHHKLVNQVDSLFAPATWNAIPTIAQLDFSEAGKCIAFERATAAAFHLLRGTEAVLRAMYLRVCARRRVDLMWGPMVIDLRKRSSFKSHGTLLDNLDNIRVNFRNPTQHPELCYTIHEAQDLWGLVTDAVNRMARILCKQGQQVGR